MTVENESALAIISRMVRHAEYLRQINSNKAFSLERKTRWMTILTVVVATGVTFIGFIGINKISAVFIPQLQPNQDAIDIVFNLLVLALLLLTILQLIYRLPERTAEHHRAITRLTDFLGPHDDMVRASAHGAQSLTHEDARATREKYLAMVAALPPNTDKEFFQAKKDYAKKRAISKKLNNSHQGLPSPTEKPATPGAIDMLPIEGSSLQEQLGKIVLASPGRRELIRTLSAFSEELSLTGGAVRNAVWDHLSGYAVSTPLEDVDVIWFDSGRADPAADKSLEERLKECMPNVQWDVKNQARMHVQAGDPAYSSLEDAMRHFPDLPSAIAVREHGGLLRIAAPYGLDALFSLRVSRSRLGDEATCQSRVATKRWATIWPKLIVDQP